LACEPAQRNAELSVVFTQLAVCDGAQQGVVRGVSYEDIVRHGHLLHSSVTGAPIERNGMLRVAYRHKGHFVPTRPASPVRPAPGVRTPAHPGFGGVLPRSGAICVVSHSLT